MCNLNIPLWSVSIGFVNFTCSISCFWNYIATFSALIIRTGNIKYFSIFVIKALQGTAIVWGHKGSSFCNIPEKKAKSKAYGFQSYNSTAAASSR